jgi:phage terminase large subunit
MPAIRPNPGQQEFALRQPYSISEILYGGARGGGKTYAGLIWLTEYINHPRFQGLVIRRNADDLGDWIERARWMYKGLGVEIVGNPVILRFPSGAIIRTGHLKDDTTFTKYQGAEYQKILIEELTQIPSQDRYMKLISSNRTTIPELKPQVFSTTNPGGIGHLWVKERFVDPCVPNTPFMGEDGLKRVYIPATIDDNPVLTTADPSYVAKLEAMRYTDEALWKAWRYGEWDIFVGQVFGEWRPREHVIKELPLPIEDCKIYAAMDWGYNDPTSIHWIAVAPENEQGVRHLYVYREMYDHGKTAEYWADQVDDVAAHESMVSFIMPHDCFSHLGGSATIASRFYAKKRLSVRSAEAKSHSAKLNRQSLLHDLLQISPDGTPYLQVLSTCRSLIRCIPALPYSDTKPEEIAEDADDHAYDSLTYGLYVITGGKSWVVNPKGPPGKRDEAYYVDEDGKLVDFHVNIEKLMKKDMRHRNWRYS